MPSEVLGWATRLTALEPEAYFRPTYGWPDEPLFDPVVRDPGFPPNLESMKRNAIAPNVAIKPITYLRTRFSCFGRGRLLWGGREGSGPGSTRLVDVGGQLMSPPA